jgi:hypothetical protein
MGFKKTDKITEIKIVLSYKMHVGENGEPIEFGFVFRNVRDGQAQEMKAELALAKKSELEQFAELLIEPPTGFDEFPLTTLEFQARHKEQLKEVPSGASVSEIANNLSVAINNAALAQRAKEYFSDDDIAYFYKDALNAYWSTVYPVCLFR